MKSSFCIDLQRFMLIPTKFPLSHKNIYKEESQNQELWLTKCCYTFLILTFFYLFLLNSIPTLVMPGRISRFMSCLIYICMLSPC